MLFYILNVEVEGEVATVAQSIDVYSGVKFTSLTQNGFPRLGYATPSVLNSEDEERVRDVDSNVAGMSLRMLATFRIGVEEASIPRHPVITLQ